MFHKICETTTRVAQNEPEKKISYNPHCTNEWSFFSVRTLFSSLKPKKHSASGVDKTVFQAALNRHLHHWKSSSKQTMRCVCVLPRQLCNKSEADSNYRRNSTNKKKNMKNVRDWKIFRQKISFLYALRFALFVSIRTSLLLPLHPRLMMRYVCSFYSLFTRFNFLLCLCVETWRWRRRRFFFSSFADWAVCDVGVCVE